MKFDLSELRLATTAPVQVLDITAAVKDALARSAIQNGLLTIISNHTTAFVNLNESEPALAQDMVAFLQALAPRGQPYRHDANPVDQRPNAHAHLAGLLMNATESIPVVGGALLLGAWQSIFLVELDGPRAARSVHVHIMGETDGQ